MQKLQRAKSRILLNHAFFGALLMSSRVIADSSIPTAATDMKDIFYNPDFFDALPPDELEGVLAHEVMHKAMEHGLRGHGRNPKLWNMAADYAINLILHESGFKLPPKVLLDDQYRDMSAEQIYDILNRNPDTRNRQFGDGEIGDDLREPQDSDDPQARAVAERQIRQQVAQAANIARMAGKLSGGLERFVDSVLNPTVPWQDLLREYATRVTNDTESWNKRNRRFSNLYLPARHNMRMGEIGVIVDTSGSISPDDLARVATEVEAIATMVKPERVRVIYVDAHLAGEQVFEEGETLDLKPCGGGGTDMRVGIDYLQLFDTHVAIMLTDGYTPWPDSEPDYPLIVCCTSKVDVPVGQVVRI